MTALCGPFLVGAPLRGLAFTTPGRPGVPDGGDRKVDERRDDDGHYHHPDGLKDAEHELLVHASHRPPANAHPLSAKVAKLIRLVRTERDALE